MRSRVIGRGVDDLRSGLTGNSIMELVLHHSIEILSDLGIPIVVDATLGKNVGDLLPDTALAGSYRTDALQQFTEIVLAENRLALLQPLIVHNKALLNILLQGFGRPDSEPGSLSGINAISNGYDSIEVVMHNGP